MNTEEYVHTMTWLQALTGLLEQMQVRPPGSARNNKTAPNIHWEIISYQYNACFFCCIYLHVAGAPGPCLTIGDSAVDQWKRGDEVILNIVYYNIILWRYLVCVYIYIYIYIYIFIYFIIILQTDQYYYKTIEILLYTIDFCINVLFKNMCF